MGTSAKTKLIAIEPLVWPSNGESPVDGFAQHGAGHIRLAQRRGGSPPLTSLLRRPSGALALRLMQTYLPSQFVLDLAIDALELFVEVRDKHF